MHPAVRDESYLYFSALHINIHESELSVEESTVAGSFTICHFQIIHHIIPKDRSTPSATVIIQREELKHAQGV